MRIALFTDTCLPTVNGVARALGLLVEHAVAAGHEVALIGPTLSAEDHPGTALHLRLPGVALPFYPELQAARPWLSPAQRRRLDDFAPHIVHVATEALVGIVGRRWARRAGVPLVTSYCTNFADYLSGYHLGFAEAWCWRHLRAFHGAAEVTFCPSRSTVGEVRRHGLHDRLRIWGRGVDSDLFHPRRRSEAVRQAMAPGAEVVLVYVGRIAPEKKVELLLEAFPEIRRRASKRVALVYVGGGPALEKLRRRRVEGVHFTGYRRGEELAAHYASADAFVFPSDTETFGQVVTEALASGIPAVAPARGGVTDTVVPGETGWLFEPGDVDDLVARTLHLVEHPDERRAMGLRARRAAEERSWDRVFERLFSDYAEVVDAAGAGPVPAGSNAGPPR
jgi:glycosyltransferase involved in cell wall biosynthesis